VKKLLIVSFMTLAGAGFLLSLGVHVASLFGIAMPGGETVFALHAGIFVVWIPTVLLGPPMRGQAGRKFWSELREGLPRWMYRGIQVLFVYALVNFVLFASNAPKKSASSPKAPPAVVRGFSGHWLVFYGTAFAVLYAARSRPEPEPE
jgi:hypothetical protein